MLGNVLALLLPIQLSANVLQKVAEDPSALAPVREKQNKLLASGSIIVATRGMNQQMEDITIYAYSSASITLSEKQISLKKIDSREYELFSLNVSYA